MMIAYIVLLITYFCFPAHLKLVIMIINFFLPDPLPFVDEVIMVAGLLKP